MATVRVSNVSKEYSRGVRAVDDVTFEVEDGEFVVVIGSSGSGKSTTLRMIAGLERPTAGVIEIGNTVVNNLAPMDRDVAMVFQNYALYPHMTVRKNLAFPLERRRASTGKSLRTVEEVAQMLDIEELLERRPGELSGGQQQRVALGRAVIRDPSVLLMDEPLSNLDAKLRVRMRSEIRDFQSRLGITTIYVTHDQTEAMTLADRIVLMKDGVVQQIDSPKSMYVLPQNRNVAQFIGSPSMNVQTGMVDTSSDEVCVNADGLKFACPLSGFPDDFVGKSGIDVGVRPDQLTLVRAGENVSATDFVRLGPVRCITSEIYGSKAIYFTETANGHPWLVESNTDGELTNLFHNGDEAELCVSTHAGVVHFFDSQTGARLS